MSTVGPTRKDEPPRGFNAPQMVRRAATGTSVHKWLWWDRRWSWSLVSSPSLPKCAGYVKGTLATTGVPRGNRTTCWRCQTPVIFLLAKKPSRRAWFFAPHHQQRLDHVAPCAWPIGVTSAATTNSLRRTTYRQVVRWDSMANMQSMRYLLEGSY